MLNGHGNSFVLPALSISIDEKSLDASELCSASLPET